jgi:26S proteasome regulatory subunit N2
LLLHDRRPEEPVTLMEVKSRKSVTQPAGGSGAAGAAGGQPAADVGGAQAAVDILNVEDDDGTEDAPLPDPFEYNTDSED